MNVQTRKVPNDVDAAVADRVTADVTAALQAITTTGSQFIINPTLWYGRSRQGKVTVQVMNSAGYLSRKFQNFLHDERGWEKEPLLSGQRIDAGVTVDSAPGYQLDKRQLVTFLDKYTTALPEASIDAVFFRYVKRNCFNLQLIEPTFHSFFSQAQGATKLRIGLEFETGNIASSFRSLNKLNFLFRQGDIDAGVFITSHDKSTTSCKIWPTSNRNGSFEELEKRNYHHTITFPIWEFSFAPDALSPTAPYLGVTGKTYEPKSMGRTVAIDGNNYEEWSGDGKELLKLIPSTR